MSELEGSVLLPIDSDELDVPAPVTDPEIPPSIALELATSDETEMEAIQIPVESTEVDERDPIEKYLLRQQILMGAAAISHTRRKQARYPLAAYFPPPRPRY